jgi:large subunit ribosomal protein L15
LADLEKKFNSGDTVDGKKLIRAGLIASSKNGVKILAGGQITKRLTIFADAFSAGAKQAIEAAGGQATVK